MLADVLGVGVQHGLGLRTGRADVRNMQARQRCLGLGRVHRLLLGAQALDIVHDLLQLLMGKGCLDGCELCCLADVG